RALKLEPEWGRPIVLGGVDVALDCLESNGWLDLARRTTQAGGPLVLAGIPVAGVDLTSLWFRELELVGAYTGGIAERGRRSSRAKGASNADGTSAFDIATRIAAETPIDGIVGATYPLRRWRSAIDHALGAGRLGTLKVACDVRAD